tara:strand:+ start:17192 stop:19405 length:2214 start_codon:yes stop_codon:yes gene_type:complete
LEKDMNSNTLPLENIDDAGSPPESRLSSADAVVDLVKMLTRADEERARVRAKVKGIVDGNPPYSPAQLKRTGQSYRTNVNFREAEAFFSIALTAFYDIFSETPTYATVKTNVGNNDAEKVAYSRIITEEFDRLQKKDEEFDYTMQLSQHEMVLFGSGPLTFESPTSWRARAIKSGDLLIPENTRSNPSDWEVAVVRRRYQAHELYGYIRDPKAATSVGWDVDATRKSIINSGPEEYRRQGSWEWHQQKIRNNDLHYSAQCSLINCAHVYVREYPKNNELKGKISCYIVREEDGNNFLYKHIGKYDSWEEVLHPMYYDKGDGQHHSVKGLGVKMYPVIELKNRQKCHMIDVAATASSMQLQAETPEAMQKASVVQMGPYSILPSGYRVVQRQFSGIADAPMAVDRELENVMQSNLSQYRQRLDKPQGNPKTATEIQAIVQQASVLGKTQIARYYQQLDRFFQERYRRAADSDVVDLDAIEFQKRVKERGVPAEALKNLDYVQASRNYGQGSAFLRLQTITGLMQISGQLPESGRSALLRDYIAALAGQQQVGRYMVEPEQDVYAKDQIAEANIENAVMQTGNPVIITDSQNHVLHIQTHLSKGSEAAQAVQQGGNPAAVVDFFRILIPHIEEHLAQLSADEGRKQEVKMLGDQLKELSGFANEVANQLAQQMEQEQQQQQEAAMQAQAGPSADEQIKMSAMERDEARKDAALQAEIERNNLKMQQEMALADAKAASSL